MNRSERTITQVALLWLCLLCCPTTARQAQPATAQQTAPATRPIAPTFLAAAALKAPPAMTGRSLLGVLTATKAGRVDASRDHVLTGRERHGPQRPQAAGYPSRAIRTDDYLYIRNFAPERWPCGEPPHTADCGMMKYLRAHKDESAIRPLYELAAGRRPAEELYHLRRDPEQISNVADKPEHAAARGRLADQLQRELRRTGDPRALGGGEVFDRYPFWGPGWRER